MPAVGSTEFFTAKKPCKKGHPPLRYVSSKKCVECSKIHSIDYARNNPVQHSLRNAAWSSKNPEKVYPKNRAWRRANREIVNAAQRVRDVKKRLVISQSDGNYTLDDRALIFELQNAQCFYCDTPLLYGKNHGDHYIPLIKGGSDARYNIVISCARCNLRKQAKDPTAFMLQIGCNSNKRPVFWGEQ